jgi:hypothetical protein
MRDAANEFVATVDAHAERVRWMLRRPRPSPTSPPTNSRSYVSIFVKVDRIQKELRGLRRLKKQYGGAQGLQNAVMEAVAGLSASDARKRRARGRKEAKS